VSRLFQLWGKKKNLFLGENNVSVGGVGGEDQYIFVVQGREHSNWSTFPGFSGGHEGGTEAIFNETPDGNGGVEAKEISEKGGKRKAKKYC